jgi:hypothetical protein
VLALRESYRQLWGGRAVGLSEATRRPALARLVLRYFSDPGRSAGELHCQLEGRDLLDSERSPAKPVGGLLAGAEADVAGESGSRRALTEEASE